MLSCHHGSRASLQSCQHACEMVHICAVIDVPVIKGRLPRRHCAVALLLSEICVPLVCLSWPDGRQARVSSDSSAATRRPLSAARALVHHFASLRCSTLSHHNHNECSLSSELQSLAAPCSCTTSPPKMLLSADRVQGSPDDGGGKTWQRTTHPPASEALPSWCVDGTMDALQPYHIKR